MLVVTPFLLEGGGCIKLLCVVDRLQPLRYEWTPGKIKSSTIDIRALTNWLSGLSLEK